MRATIKRELNNEQKVRFVVGLLTSLYDFPSLTNNEIALIKNVLELPDVYRHTPTPFSLTMKKIYRERLNISATNVDNIIQGLFKKGYLIKDEYGEWVMIKALRNFLKDDHLELNLDLMVSDKRETKEEIK